MSLRENLAGGGECMMRVENLDEIVKNNVLDHILMGEFAIFSDVEHRKMYDRK